MQNFGSDNKKEEQFGKGGDEGSGEFSACHIRISVKNRGADISSKCTEAARRERGQYSPIPASEKIKASPSMCSISTRVDQEGEGCYSS